MKWPLDIKGRVRKIHQEEKKLKAERKNLQLELTLEQLCSGVKTIEGAAVFKDGNKTIRYWTTVHQPSTASPKRIEEIQVRLNQIYQELFLLVQEKKRLTNSRKLRPVLHWGKFLADVELHWI